MVPGVSQSTVLGIPGQRQKEQASMGQWPESAPGVLSHVQGQGVKGPVPGSIKSTKHGGR